MDATVVQNVLAQLLIGLPANPRYTKYADVRFDTIIGWSIYYHDDLK